MMMIFYVLCLDQEFSIMVLLTCEHERFPWVIFFIELDLDNDDGEDDNDGPCFPWGTDLDV